MDRTWTREFFARISSDLTVWYPFSWERYLDYLRAYKGRVWVILRKDALGARKGDVLEIRLSQPTFTITEVKYPELAVEHE